MSTYEELEQAKFPHNKTKEKLRERKKRFSIILHTKPAAIALTRPVRSQSPDTNKAWQDMIGNTHSETVGQRAIEALELSRVKPHTLDPVITEVTGSILTGDKRLHELMKIRHDIQ